MEEAREGLVIWNAYPSLPSTKGSGSSHNEFSEPFKRTTFELESLDLLQSKWNKEMRFAYKSNHLVIVSHSFHNFQSLPLFSPLLLLPSSRSLPSSMGPVLIDLCLFLPTLSGTVPCRLRMLVIDIVVLNVKAYLIIESDRCLLLRTPLGYGLG